MISVNHIQDQLSNNMNPKSQIDKITMHYNFKKQNQLRIVQTIYDTIWPYQLSISSQIDDVASCICQLFLFEIYKLNNYQYTKQDLAIHPFYNQYFPQVVLMSSVFVSYKSEHSTTNSVASFLLKTFEILEKAEFSNIISWTSDDDTFAIKNILQFTNQVLPKYFRHRNFSSFVRQLNMYDFHKIKQSNGYIVFRNPLFRKGENHLLRKIRRKAPKKNYSQKKVYSNTGINLSDCNLQQKQAIQSGIYESTQMFEKSLVYLQTIYSLVQKNHFIFGSSCSSHLQSLDVPSILDIVTQVKNFSNSCFRQVMKQNEILDRSLQQKYFKYCQLQRLMTKSRSKKNVSTGSLSGSSDSKSQCSIGNKKQDF